MKIACIGGGPASLFFSILMAKQDAGHDITVYERNRRGDTFGFGVVFSDETLANIAETDPESIAAIESGIPVLGSDGRPLPGADDHLRRPRLCRALPGAAARDPDPPGDRARHPSGIRDRG